MKLSEYLKQNNMTTKEYFEMQGRRSNGITTLTDYRNSLYQNIGFDTFDADLNAMNETLGGIYGGWQDAQTMKNTRSSVEGMYNRLLSYEDYRKNYGSDDWTDLSELTNAYKGALDEWDALSEGYSSYKNADEFNMAVKKAQEKAEADAKLRQEMLSADLDAVQDELSLLETYLNTAKPKRDEAEIKENEYIDNMSAQEYQNTTRSPGRAGANRRIYNDYYTYMNSIGYASIEDLDKAITEKKNFLEEATILQKEDEALKSEDFEQYSTIGRELKYESGLWSDSGNYVTYIKNEPDKMKGQLNTIKADTAFRAAPKLALAAYGTDDEYNVYNYYLGQEEKGLVEKGTADDYINSIMPRLEERWQNEKLTEANEFAHNHKVLGSIKSVGHSLAGAGEFLIDSVAYGITGEMDDNFNARTSSTIRSRVSQDVDWEIGNWDAFDFLYNTGMSMVDSASVMWMPGASGAVVLGLSAAGQGVNDALDRGLDSKQAFWNGMFSGAFEMAFEKFSIGNFKAFKDMSVDGLKAGFKNLGKSMLVNASEETLTEIANITYDKLAHGDFSHYAIRMQELIDSGMSKEEATRKVNLEMLDQSLQAGASGAFMGMGFGTVGNIIAAHNTKAIGKSITANENVGKVFDMASVSPEASTAYEAYTQYANKGVTAENAKTRQVGALALDLKNDALKTLNDRNSTEAEKAQAEKVLSDLEAYGQNTSVSRFGKGNVKKLFGNKEKVNALIDDALSRDENTEVYKLATEYKAKLESGKELSEKELTKLVDATTFEAKSNARVDVEKRLVELGETENVAELSEIISKASVGQKLSSAEIEMLESSENANKVFSEIDKSSNVELMEAVEGIEDKADAELFIKTYDGHTDVDYYTDSFNLVKDYAKDNYSVDFILENSHGLTPRQVQQIYNKVVTEPRAEQQKALDELVKKYEGKLVHKANIDDSIFNGENGKKLWRNLNSRQKQAITFAKAFAKGAGVNLKITYNGRKGGKAYNGYYDPSTNTIVIDARAGFDARYTKDAIIPTLSHELTHWMKQKAPELYAELSQKIFGVLEKSTGKSEYELIAKEQKKHPEYTDDQARDEIIARACEDLFSMSETGREIFNSLSETEQKTLKAKIKEIVNTVLEWVNKLLGMYESKSTEAQSLRAFEAELQDILKTWDQMLAKSIEANAALEAEGVFDSLENGISEDGTTIVGEGNLQMSEKTYREGGRDFLVKWLDGQKGISKKDKQSIVEQTDRIADLMRAIAEGNDLPNYSRWADMEVVKDENGEKILSVIVKNGDYAMNIDFSQVCKKRVALNAVLNAMVKSGDLNVHTLTETDVAELNAIIKKHDFEIACALCFVDSKRYRVGAWAESFCEGADDKKNGKKIHKYGFNEMVRSLIPEGSKLNADEFNFTGRDIKNQPTKNLLSEANDSELDFSLIDKIMAENDSRSAQHRYAKAIKENPDIRKILNSAEIISSIGLDAIRLESPKLYGLINGHQGTAKPKFSHDVVAYGNDILKASNFTAEVARMVGGVRCQSFSDFMASMVVDYAQFISELSAKKLTSHSYTKEPLFVKLFGLTGMKINMSLVPKAIDMTPEQQERFAILKDKDANKKSKAYKEALAEYEKLAENAGLDENGNYIWEDETFPYDIAMEIVVDRRYSKNCGTIAVGISNNHIRKLLADPRISMVIPYYKSGLNHEVAMMRDIALYKDYTDVQNTRFADGKKLDGVPDFNFYGDLYGVDGKKGTHDPKKTAQNYLAWCKENNYIPKFDDFAGDLNYYKLLIDFRVYDVDGTYAEQQPVQTIYPSNEEFTDLILNGVKDKDGKVYGGLRQQQETSDKLSRESQQIIDEYRESLREKYGQDVLVQFSPKDVGYENKVFDFGITQNEINSYVENAYLKENKKPHIKFLEASSRLIKDVSSDVDISGYAHALRDNDIRHIRNSHGELTNEKYPVTQSDIQMIPFVVENYDKVFYKTNANNQPGLLYVKVMPENVIYYVEAITEEYGKEKLLINKQMIKAGINEIPNLAGVIDAINKKMSSSQYLADLEKIRKAYVQDVKENYSNNSILNSPEKNNSEIVNNEDVQFAEKDYGRITADMSDEERTEILSKKSIVAPIYKGQADENILKENDNLLSKEEKILKAAIKRIGEQFGVFTDDKKPISVKDMDFGVFFSRGSADESSNKKVTDIKQLAKLLPILRDAVENSVGVECHNNRYFADHNTNEFYELLGGYIEGDNFIPVRFGVKGFKDGTYSLYIVVCQDEIEKTKVIKPSSSDLNGSQNGSHLVSDISISRVIKFVKGKDLLRYLPDGMLNENQRKLKYEGLAETIKYTNEKNDRKYKEFIENKDMDSAERMVKAAAKANGYTFKAYHGGDHFFTVFGKGNKTSSAPDGAYFFTDNKDVAYSYTAYKNIVDLNVNNHPIYKQATPDGRIEENRVSHGGVYPVYLKLQNPYIVDFEGRHWGNKVNGMDINEIAVWAKENNYDGVIAKNIIDAGDMGNVNYEEGNTRVPSTDYIIFDSARAKSSETITYDDNGNIIPISERFNSENDDIRFSEKDYGTSAYDLVGEYKTLEKRYKKLESDFENYKERVKLDRTLTKGRVMQKSQLEAVARFLVKHGESNYNVSELAKILNDVYVDIQDGATDGTMTFDEMYAKCYEVAEKIRTEAKVKVERPALYDKILKDIRSARVAPNAEQKGDAKHRFGDHYIGKFRGRVIIANDGVPLDQKWSEWAALYPSVFDKNTSPSQQLVELYDIYEDLRNAGDVVQEYEESEMLHSLATEIVNKAWTVTKYESTADKYDRRIKELKAEHRKAMEELRDTYQKKESDAKLLEQMYYGKLLNQVQTKRKQDVAEAKRLGREKLAQYRENAERKSVIQAIENVSLALNKKLTTNSKDVHIPESLKPVVVNLLNAIDFSSQRMLNQEEPTKRDFAIDKSLSKVHSMDSGTAPTVSLKQSIEDALKLFQNAEKVSNGTSDGNADISIVALDTDAIADIEKMITHLNMLTENGKPSFVLQEMSTEDLKTLNKMVRSIRHWASVADQALANKHKKRVSDLSIQTIDETKMLGDRQEYVGKIENVKDFFNWSNLLPVNAFHRLGISATEFFDGLRDSQDKLTFNRQLVMDFMDNLIGKYKKQKINIKDWRTDVKTFDVQLPGEENTTKVKMPVSFIMTLYCVAKQEDAKRHLYGKDASGNKLTYTDEDGKVYDGGGMTIKGYKEGKFKLKVNKNLDNTIINESIVKQITSVLTKEQIEVADAMQEFMDTTGSEWGNAVSMALYGIKKFGIKNYFPLSVSPHTLPADMVRNDKASLFSILNYGLTKERNPLANQSIEIGDIFDVFANHMNMIAIYNAYALSIYDIARWYNFKGKAENGKEIAVTKSIEKAFGKGATTYVSNLIKDLNGQHASSRLGFIGQILKNEKVAMVGNSLSVALLQPTAYFKAMTKISPKYLLKAAMYIRDFGAKKGVEKAQKYCGIALLKSQGYFETGVSANTTTKMLHDESLHEKAIEWSLKGAEIMDEKTWGVLWNACEFEVRATRKDLKVGSEEFYEAIGEKLRDVIYETQVVDSPLTKSDLMRSPDTGAKMITMFASEMTVAYNMVYESVYNTLLDTKKYGKNEALKKNRKNILMNLASYTLTGVATGILQTAVQNLRKGFRDDDEDKEFEDLVKEAMQNVFSEWLIIGKIPYFKEIVNIAEGYSPSLPGFSWLISAFKAYEAFVKASEGKEGQILKATEEIMKTFSYGMGIAIYNQWRELKGTLKTIGIME